MITPQNAILTKHNLFICNIFYIAYGCGTGRRNGYEQNFAPNLRLNVLGKSAVSQINYGQAAICISFGVVGSIYDIYSAPFTSPHTINVMIHLTYHDREGITNIFSKILKNKEGQRHYSSAILVI